MTDDERAELQTRIGELEGMNFGLYQQAEQARGSAEAAWAQAERALAERDKMAERLAKSWLWRVLHR